MKYVIDARGMKIGRAASRAAAALMGKNSVSFARNGVAAEAVEITNASKAEIPAKKRSDKIYVSYTGHRGGLKSETLNDLMKRRGMEEVFRRAVRRMLPDNKLRERRMKNLIIKD